MTTQYYLQESDLDNSQPIWFERQVMRSLILSGWLDVRHVGASGDGGADVIGTFEGERWVVQVKASRARASIDAIKDLERAATLYNAQHCLGVARSGWTAPARRRAQEYGGYIQLASGYDLVDAVEANYPLFIQDYQELYLFQEEAVTELQLLRKGNESSALIALATGLGKTVIAAEYARRSLEDDSESPILVLAHSQDILTQSERTFWRHIPKSVSTHQINGQERPVRSDGVTFATFQTMNNLLQDSRYSLPEFPTVIVDECHHAGASTFSSVIDRLNPEFLIGLTATPWRSDEIELRQMFGDPAYSKSIIEAMNEGWLSEVDYRLLTDNIPWDDLPNLTGKPVTIRQLNARLFIPQLEDAIVDKIQAHYSEIGKPRGLVFCRTIESATRISRLINARGFARSEVISSRMQPGERRIDREIKLMRFGDGEIDILCGVDIFNEGIDVPDVNLLVFLRVTHSRRIFVQQLGRGLRWQPGKVVRVLDFVSDVRRIAAILKMDSDYRALRQQKSVELELPGTLVQFDGDREASFFREWLYDVADLEDVSEQSELAFPPPMRD